MVLSRTGLSKGRASTAIEMAQCIKELGMVASVMALGGSKTKTGICMKESGRITVDTGKE